ncbi:MAG: DEAD/DEAH box helicase family protein [Candidatus Aminicenantes bacterium]|nr:MAG: DEAD/DEAH box helicase family protein [Candidatus Aminicenantes bacterium]
MPPLIEEGLWACQVDAIENLEKSFAQNRPRALIQMATGTGKTFTAVSFIYRLIKFAKAARVLFLVDRYNLGRQALAEFIKFIIPNDGRKFTELYNVQHLRSNKLDTGNNVIISTIQRIYSMLKGEPEFDESLEERSLFEMALPGNENNLKLVTYNHRIPIETFDFIITDECHRSIYNLWRQVLEYFDAFIIGLTATPSKQTLGFFDRNLVKEYSHDRAVADGVNVNYEVYRIKTKITKKGSRVEAGFYIDRRCKQTRAVRWERLDEDLVYYPQQLDKQVVAKDQIRTIIRTFKEKLFTDLFPGRKEIPKTVIFAKDDSHAEDIVEIVRTEFGKGNEFCKKITYKSANVKPDDLIAEFRNSYNPRVAVTVDMIATGTDIKPLECLLFMRDVRSITYFEQMKGRGTRTINDTDLRAVTPDARSKTLFIIVDAVGVCESDKTDSYPMEKKRSMTLKELMEAVARGHRDEEILTSLAGRLARLDRQMSNKDRNTLQKVVVKNGFPPGLDITQMVNHFLDVIDPDKQKQQNSQELIDKACKPFEYEEIRETIAGIKKDIQQVIDKVSEDQVLFSGYDEEAREKAEKMVKSFKAFIRENKDELTALQIIYNQPYGRRQLTYDHIRQLAEAIKKPPYHLTPGQLWRAYEKLEKSKVKNASPHRILADIISLVRFALGETDLLEPFEHTVEHRFREWLEMQKQAGQQFTFTQLEWLNMMKDHIAASLSISMDDFQYIPFHEKGGAVKVYQLFGEDLNRIIDELNHRLVA